MAIGQGDIYWVTLVGEGSVQTGRRPCIIMSRMLVNEAGRTIVAVPLTSETRTANQYYRILIPASEILRDAGSNSTVVDSVAKCDHVRVLDKTRSEEHTSE